MKLTKRDKHLKSIRLSDRKWARLFAPMIAWIANAVAICWAVLFGICILNRAPDGMVLFGLAGLPVIIFWYAARRAPQIVEWLFNDLK